MENKELIAFRNTKPHQKKETLANLWNEYQDIKVISNLLHISRKLATLKIKEHGIIR
jgi:hypothetical protein